MRKSGSGPWQPNEGIGQPHEPGYFYPQYRGPGNEQARTSAPLRIVGGPGEHPAVQFVQMPAFQMPPYFAQPIVVLSETTLQGNGQEHYLAVIPIEAEYRLIVTATAMETDAPQELENVQVWFARAGGDMPLPILSTQQGGTALASLIESPLLPLGRARRLPGTMEAPFCWLTNGLQFQVIGPDRLTVKAVKMAATPNIHVCILLAAYRYPMFCDAAYFRGEVQR